MYTTSYYRLVLRSIQLIWTIGCLYTSPFLIVVYPSIWPERSSKYISHSNMKVLSSHSLSNHHIHSTEEEASIHNSELDYSSQVGLNLATCSSCYNIAKWISHITPSTIFRSALAQFWIWLVLHCAWILCVLISHKAMQPSQVQWLQEMQFKR
jgi:hypothetical protein